MTIHKEVRKWKNENNKNEALDWEHISCLVNEYDTLENVEELLGETTGEEEMPIDIKIAIVDIYTSRKSFATQDQIYNLITGPDCKWEEWFPEYE